MMEIKIAITPHNDEKSKQGKYNARRKKLLDFFKANGEVLDVYSEPAEQYFLKVHVIDVDDEAITLLTLRDRDWVSYVQSPWRYDGT